MSRKKSNLDKGSKPNSYNKNKNDSKNINPELITAYVDNEISSDEKELVQESISNNHKQKLRYEFERLTKDEFRNRVKKIETPQYLHKNIKDRIDEYCESVNSKNNTSQRISPPSKSEELYRRTAQPIPTKYVYSIAGVFVLLIFFFIILNIYYGKDISSDNNFVAISRTIYDDIESGKMKMEYTTDNAKELENILENRTGYNVFIPDVKSAVLVGGLCNEMNGQQIVHFVYKKNNYVIYTLQTSRPELFKGDKLALSEDYKQKINNGANWFPCMKKDIRNAVIWYNDDVICSSVSKIPANEIHATLTSFK